MKEQFWIHVFRDRHENVMAVAIEDYTAQTVFESSGTPLLGLPFEDRMIFSHQVESERVPTIAELSFTDDAVLFDGKFAEQEDFGEWIYSTTLTEWCEE